MDTGVEDLHDQTMKVALRKQALRVQLKALVMAVLLTAITLLF